MKIAVLLLKKLELLSAVSARIVKLTGKSDIPIHPKHLIKRKSVWYQSYIKKQDILLDLGCGSGTDLVFISKKLKKAIGTDIDKQQLANAKKLAARDNIQNLEFIYHDLNKKLPFKSNFFDKLVASDVIEHIFKRDFALNEMRRVLKNKGYLFLVVDNPDTSWKRLQKRHGLFYYADRDHKYEYPKEEIEKVLKAKNFRITSSKATIYDTPFKGVIDLIGSFSISYYKKLGSWREKMTIRYPQDSTGFMIVAQIFK